MHEIDQAHVAMGLVIPRDYAQQVDGGRKAPVQLIVDGTDSNTATIAIGYADAIAQIYALDLQVERSQRCGGSRPVIPLDVRPRVWYNEDLNSRNYIIPGLIAVIMMVISAMLTSLTVAREWERGTMEQLISTPLKVSELILGKLTPYFAVGAFSCGANAHRLEACDGPDTLLPALGPGSHCMGVREPVREMPPSLEPSPSMVRMPISSP